MILKFTRVLSQFSTKINKPIPPSIHQKTKPVLSTPLQQPSPLKKIPKKMPQQHPMPILTNNNVQSNQPLFQPKRPVITVMGHVDHGKTTLIDYLRKSNIAGGEAGGITQKIGAFTINHLGKNLTFIDTPGHQAFINMRKRGASLTDLVILIVSATEGVKQQTKQVISILKEDNVPFIVAINKIDLQAANPENAEEQLEKAGVSLDINGGNVPVVHISAKEGLNIDLLYELLLEETRNLKAVFEGGAEASVLEATKNKEGINSMTIIMEKGTLKQGNLIVIGDQYYKVKEMQNDLGEKIEKAFPGDAVQVMGIPSLPEPGDELFSVSSEVKANFFIQKKKNEAKISMRKGQEEKEKEMETKIKFKNWREKRAFFRGVTQIWEKKFTEQENIIQEKLCELKEKQQTPTIKNEIKELEKKLAKHKEYVYEYMKNSGTQTKCLNAIIRFGDKGMEETVLLQLEKLKESIENTVGITLRVLSTDIGEVTSSDIEFAKTMDAEVFTFGADIGSAALQAMADWDKEPKVHKLIHTLLADIKDTCIRKKAGNIKGVEVGRATIMQVFKLKKGKGEIDVPGIKVLKGIISKKNQCYVFRGAVPISKELNLHFLKIHKQQKSEFNEGEIGTLGFVEDLDFQLQQGDEIVSYEVK